jgi:hypothetical protein
MPNIYLDTLENYALQQLEEYAKIIYIKDGAPLNTDGVP